jgi:hypothetical protein
MSGAVEIPHERVCPHCGMSAEEADYCGGCGLHLAALPELPSRAEWTASVRPAAPTAQIPPAGAPTQVLPPPPQHVGFSQTPSPMSVFGSSSSIAPLLHPTEASRLVLALIASAIALLIPLILIIQAGGFGVLLEVLTVVVVTVWIGIQLSRARLLGRSVRVDPNTFPELNAIVAEVSATLDYRRRIEVYVTDKVPQSIVTTSLLGTRMIIIEGSLVADLLKPGKQPQLTFLIGRSIGALSARHERLELLIRIMEAAEVLKYVAPFIRPYYRATAYSGDQIGMMCCSDLEAALEATRRLLVGPEMASQLTAGAVVPQAKFVKERVLPRLVQLLAVEPHVTNRYANLLCFGRYHTPDLWAAMSSSMDEHEQRCLEEIWQSSAYRWRVAAG